ncbi:MAG: ABC transporter permease [Gaiellaceae bacterium]
MRLLLHQIRAEQRLFWRQREAAVFVFLLPILLFLLLGAVYDGRINGHPAASYLLTGMLGYGVASTAFAGLAITLIIRREYGLLKRIRSTPLTARTYLAAVLLSTLVVFAVQSLVLLGLGAVLFDAELPSRVLSLVLALLLGAAAFAGIGLGAASLLRSAEGSSAGVNVILLPMAFLSGSFGPTREYPGFLRAIADVLPLKYMIDLVGAIYLEGREVWTRPGAVAVVAAWGLAGLAVALRRFDWEPRER